MKDTEATQGHCNRCGKVWTLDTASGKCQWCGKQATCQTTSQKTTRPLKASRRRPETPRRQLGQGYDQLDTLWANLYTVAVKYAHKAMAQDREDLLHDILLTLYRATKAKPDLTTPALYRIASRAVMDYWRAHYRHTNGLDCGHCSKAQRRDCSENDRYTECPKAIKLESLEKPVLDSEGNLTELGKLIADPESLDVDVWERKTYLWELGYPRRQVQIAYKLKHGESLTHGERTYLSKIRKREQKKLL